MTTDKNDDQRLKGSDLAIISQERKEELKEKGLISSHDDLLRASQALPKKNAGRDSNMIKVRVIEKTLSIWSLIYRLKTKDSFWRWLILTIIGGIIASLLIAANSP